MTLFVLMVFLSLLVGVNFYLRNEIRHQILQREAELIYSVSLLEFSIVQDENGLDFVSDDIFEDVVLNAASRTTKLRGVFGVELFLPDGATIDVIPKGLTSTKLNLENLQHMKRLQTVSRFHPHERIGNLFNQAPLLSADLKIPLLELIVRINLFVPFFHSFHS